MESNQGNSSTAAKGSHKTGKLTDIEIFTGFKPAIEACFLDWDDHPIPGVTYGKNAKYLCPFTVFRHPTEADELVRAGGQVNSSQAVLRCEFPGVSKSHSPRTGHRSRTQSESQGPGGAVRSSLSSEEVPSDEGVEEAPSQSEEEGTEYPRAGPLSKLKLLTAQEKLGQQGSSGEKCDDESSPERDLESDWSSGQSEAQRGGEEGRGAEAGGGAASSDPLDYRVYFYDPKVPITGQNEDGKEEIDVFKNLRKIEDAWEILFMRAEGIHAHGYQAHACDMAVRLALDMLKNPPDLITDAPPISFKGSYTVHL